MRYPGHVALVVVCAVASLAGAQDQSLSPDRAAQLRERYEQVLLARPMRGAAFERLYQSYTDGEGVQAWIDRLTAQAKEHADQAVWPLILGYVHERAGDTDQALAAYAQTRQIDPRDHRAPAAQGRLLHHLRRNDEAAESLRAALALNPPEQDQHELTIALGRSLAAAGKGDEAVATWLRLAEARPDDAAAIEELADLLAEQGRPEDALKQYANLQRIATDDYIKVRAAFAASDLHVQLKQYDPAIARLTQQMDNLAPGSWLRAEARRKIEQAHRSANRQPQLEAFYADWIKAHDDDIEMRLALASLQRRGGKLTEAEATLKQIVERTANHREANAELAELHLEQGRYGDAAAAYRKLCEQDPGDARLWERMGQIIYNDLQLSEPERRRLASDAWANIYSQRQDDASRAVLAAEVYRSGRMEEQAIAHYEHAIRLSPQETTYYEYLAQYLHELKRDDEAVKRLTGMVEGDRDTPVNRLRQAEVLTGMGLAEPALAAIDAALARAGADAFKLLSMRAAAMMRARRYDDAAGALDKLAEAAATYDDHRQVRLARVELHQQRNELPQCIAAMAEPKDADGWEMLALLHRAASHRAEAAGAMARSLTLDEKNPARLSLAADLYNEAGKSQEAIQTLRRLVAVEPSNQATHIERIADLAHRARDFEAALAAADRLIELTPESDRGYVLAADMHVGLGKLDSAVDVLRRGLRRNPRDEVLLAALAQRVLARGDTREGVDLYWRIYETSAEDHDKLRAAGELAKIHVQAGDFPRFADQLMERRRDPKEERVASLALASAYRLANQPERAIHILERMLAMRHDDPDLLDQIMTLCTDMGRTEQAIEHARKLLTLRPDDTTLQRRLGELLYDAGRVDEAIARWRGSLTAADTDAVGSALRLAELLSKYGLDSDALDVLNQAAARFPDNWRMNYDLAVKFKSVGRTDRVAAMLDALINRPRPAGDKDAANTNYPSISYLGFSERSPAVNQWINLPQIQQFVTQELSMSSQRSSMFAFSGRVRYGGGMGSSYMPPDFESMRLAALLHRLHLAELQGELPAFLDRLEAAATAPLQQLIYLRALLLTQQSDRAYDAVRRFCEAAPEDPGLLALHILAHVATPELNPQQFPPPGNLDPAADVDAMFDRLVALDESAAVPLVPYYVRRLAASKQTDKVGRWLDWAVAREKDIKQAMLTLMRMPMEPGSDAMITTYARKFLPRVREAIATAPPAEASQVVRYYGYMTQRRMMNGEPTAAAEAMAEWAGLLDQLPPSAGRQTGDVPVFSFQHGDTGRLPFPSSNRIIDQQVFQLISGWIQQLPAPAAKGAAAAALKAVRDKAPEARRPTLTIMTAIALGQAGDINAARDLVAEQVNQTPSDEWRLVLAQILAQQNDAVGAWEQISRIQAATGTIADEALAARVLLSDAAKQEVAGKEAAEKLARAGLNPDLRQRLTNWMTSHGMTAPPSAKQPVAAHSPVAISSVGRGAIIGGRRAPGQPAPDRRVELLQRMTQEKNLTGAANLAKRMLMERSSMQMRQQEVESQTAAAIAALRAANALDSFIAELEASFEKEPSSTVLMSRLWLIHSATGRQDKAQAVLEKLFNASPNNMMVRYQFASSLAQQGNYAVAAPHFEKVLEAEPSLIQEGWLIAYSFREANKLDRFAELVEKIKPTTRRITIMPNYQQSRDWLLQAGQNLEQQDAKIAVRVLLKHREITTQPENKAAGTATLMRIATRLGDADLLEKQWAHLLPETSAGAAAQPQGQVMLGRSYMPGQMLNVVQTLFQPQYTGQPVRDGEAPTMTSIMWQALDLLQSKRRLDQVEAMLEAGKADAGWQQTLGLPIRAALDVRKDPPALEAVTQIVERCEKPGAQNDHMEIGWRFAVAGMLTPAMSSRAETAPLGLRMAEAVSGLQNPWGDQRMQVNLIAMVARAAAKSGDAAKARTQYQKLAGIEHQQRRQMRQLPPAQQTQQNVWMTYEEFNWKSPHLAGMIRDGCTDIAIDMLVRYNTELAASPRQGHEQQMRQSIAAMMKDAEAKRAIDGELDRLAAAVEQTPDDAASVRRLLRLYDLTGQPDKGAALAMTLGDNPALEWNDRLNVAVQWVKTGKIAEARKVAIAMLDADNEKALGERINDLVPAFPDLAACEELVAAMERYAQRHAGKTESPHWIDNLAQPVRQAASGKQNEEAKAFRDLEHRMLIVADRLSATNDANQPLNRPWLSRISTRCNDYDEYERSYAYLFNAVFEADKTAIPAPTPVQLMAQSGTYNHIARSIATDLVDAAQKSGKLDILAKAVDDQAAKDPMWEAAAARMRALIALQRADASAGELLGRVSSSPLLDPNRGYDASFVWLGQRAIGNASTREAGVKLLRDAFEASRGNSQARRHMQELTGPVIAAISVSGDLQTMREAMASSWISMQQMYSRQPEMSIGLMLGLCRFAAAEHREAGRPTLALDYYRVLLRYPHHNPRHVNGDRTRNGVEQCAIELLEQLHRENKLDAYLTSLDESWRQRAQGIVNAEPLVTLAVGRLVQGRVADAAATFDRIDAADFPAGAALITIVLERNPSLHTPEAFALLRRAVLRSPHLFARQGNQIARLHQAARHPLPVDDSLTAIAAQPPTITLTTRRGELGAKAAPISFDGSPDLPGAMPPDPADARTLAAQFLQSFLQEFKQQRSDDQFVEFMAWAHPYVTDAADHARWNRLLGKENAADAVDGKQSPAATPQPAQGASPP